MIDYRIPEIGEIVIEIDGNIPFVVEKVTNGLVCGSAGGCPISYPIENDLHVLDWLDL